MNIIWHIQANNTEKKKRKTKTIQAVFTKLNIKIPVNSICMILETLTNIAGKHCSLLYRPDKFLFKQY